jgi:hypothetical protein
MKTTLEICKEAGFPLLSFEGVTYVSPELERLVALVRADERKQVALDKKAENARELGLDYEPVLKDNSNYRYDPPVAEPEKQEPVAWRNAAIRLGEELSSVGPDGYYNMTAEQWLDWAMDQHPQGKNSLTTPPAAPVAWKWHQAPFKTSWGHDMVVADLAIDKDNTVSVYCERDQTAKVEAMFNPPAAPVQEPGRNHYEDGDVFERIAAMKKSAAQRQWIELTNEEIEDCYAQGGIGRAMKMLKEKNT